MTGVSHERAEWLAAHVLPHEPRLRQRLARAGLSDADIDDAVQEAYAKLIRLETVAHVRDPAAYLLQTARSVHLQMLRRSRVVSIDAVADLDALGHRCEEPGPDRQLESRQELRLVASAIGSLPRKCREVLLLKKVDGLSQREIASQLGVTESNVEKLLGRGVRKLMDLMSRSDKEAGANTRDRTLKASDHAGSSQRQRY